MKILISAYSCNPYKGSEDAVGWNWVLQYSKNSLPGDKIVLLTKRFNEKDIRRGFSEFGIDNVELWISDVPSFLNWFREKHSFFHAMYYYLWQKFAYFYVKKRKYRFDIIHHVTMTDYRCSGFLQKMKGSYSIFGPVGGGEEIPKPLKKYQTRKFYELARTFVNKSRNFSPTYRRLINQYSVVYAANEETAGKLSPLYRHNIAIVPAISISKPFCGFPYKDITFSPNIHFLFAGKDLPRKGLQFLLDSLCWLPKDFEYSLDIALFGENPNIASVQKRLDNLKLSKNVKVYKCVSFDKMKHFYPMFDVFVFPSLREAGGNVLIEAMACGLPIIGFDKGFCQTLSKRRCGIFVNPDVKLDDLQKSFAQAMIRICDSSLRKILSHNGFVFANELTWENKYNSIINTYRNHAN